MENSVSKPAFSQIVTKKPRSSVYIKKLKEFAGKPCSEKKDHIVGHRNETELVVESENSDTFKETRLSGFGLGIKRRRNGSNVLRVKPNGPDSEPDSSGPSDSACLNDSPNDTDFSVSNGGVLKQIKPENFTSVKNLVHAERDEQLLEKGESNSSSVDFNFSSHRAGNSRKKNSKEYKENRLGLNSNGDFREEELLEETLEVNAARMLCSLFDNNSSNLSVPNPLNGPNGLSWVLRPGRREGFANKTCHVHQASCTVLNPFCIVEQKIRVFWPLDQCWYIGLVKEYDPLTRLHYVRYDDDEEEWLNLQNERFKLLFFPSEIPSKLKRQNSNLNSKQNIEDEKRKEDDSNSNGSVGSSVDSEPIVSFLTRSSYQSKPVQLPVPVPVPVPVPSSSNNNNNNEMRYNKSPVKDKRFSIVYSRKRFRNKKENPNSTSLSNSLNKAVPVTTLIVPVNRDLTLKLNFPIELLIGRVLIGDHSFWYFHSLYLLLNGGLVSVWPKIKLEIIISDDSFGSNYFLFEINLRAAVSLFCLLVRVFEKTGFEFQGVEKPVCRVKCSISGLNGGRVILALFSFFGICDKKWAFLQKRIRSDEYSCLKMVQLSKEDILLQKGLLIEYLIPHSPIFSGINPMIYYIKKRKISFKPFSKIPQNNAITTGDSITTKNINQITHLVALPAPIQVQNPLIQFQITESKTPKAPRTTQNRARNASFAKLWNDAHPSRSLKNARTDHSYSFQKAEPVKNEPLDTCYANLLVTDENKGWRESNANVTINSDERDKLRLSVQINGEVRYTHHPTQVLQPGSTNRYTHAMMWRAGSAWLLEFPDRNQWFLFKQMYEKCYNQNMRASCVKNIPTPDIYTVVEDVNNSNFTVPFTRGTRYITHAGSEVERALDFSRVLYDMDSEDEDWVEDLEEIGLSDDIFELVMDRCEKIAYENNCVEFKDDQIEELISCDAGPEEIVKEVYEYWLAKRKDKGMPLIRQLQPPLWKHYEKLLEEWEALRRRRKKSIEKPSMFAFCLKPRGFQPVKEGMKLRSHKRLPPNATSRTHWRSNEPSKPNKKKTKTVHQTRENPARTEIPIPAFDTGRVAPSLPNSQTRIRIKQASRSVVPNVTNTVRAQPDDFCFLKEDEEEFKLRDASNCAQHLGTMARMKREKVRLLANKADLALHKARVSVMISDALRCSREDDRNA